MRCAPRCSIAALPDPAAPALAAIDCAIMPQSAWDARGFYRLLDRMLFRAAEPAERYKVLERFYGLDAGADRPLLRRRDRPLLDKLRILSGRPPVPLGRARCGALQGDASLKTAAVIGAGFGGLALAIRLQSAGVATTLIEARDKPGGRAYVWERDGFTFDAGPTVITDPACLRELWALSGRRHGGRCRRCCR